MYLSLTNKQQQSEHEHNAYELEVVTTSDQDN